MEIKPRPRPLTYIMQRYVRISGPFYSRNQNRRVSTPERLHEHCIGYINIVTTYDCWISALLEVEATAPSKTDSTNNEHTTTQVGQELHPFDLKCTLCHKTKSCQNSLQHHHLIRRIQITGCGTGFMAPAPPSSAQDARPTLTEH